MEKIPKNPNIWGERTISMEQLPSELLDAILVRVALPEMMQSVPVVCKKWNQSTRCPSFTRAYQLHHGEWLIIGDMNPNGPSMRFYLFNIRSWYKLRLDGLCEYSFDNSGPVSCFGAGPFLGLHTFRTCVVGNPLTNQWYHLDLHSPKKLPCLFLVPKISGSNSLYDYTLMATEYSLDNPNATQVYDFETESWTVKAVSPLSVLNMRVDYQVTSGFVYCLELQGKEKLPDGDGRRDYSHILLARYDVRLEEWKSMVAGAPEELEGYPSARAITGIFPAVVQCCGDLLLVGRMNKRTPMRDILRTPGFGTYFYNVVAVWRLARPNWGQDHPGKDEWELISECPCELMEELINHTAVHRLDGNVEFRVCSDEQTGSLWFFMPWSDFMLSFSLPLRQWKLLPGLGAQAQAQESDRTFFEHVVCSNLSFAASIMPSRISAMTTKGE